MYEQEDIAGIEVMDWANMSCTHVFFRDRTEYCSDRGLIDIEELLKMVNLDM